jgi:hypothetical protein
VARGWWIGATAGWATQKEIARWSEPLVADHIYPEYERYFGGKNELSEELGRRHCRVWRNLLNGEAPHVKSARGNLLKLAHMVNLDDGALEAIDAAIFNDLLDVILRRCHGSRDKARLDGMTLVQAASMLGEIRKAA